MASKTKARYYTYKKQLVSLIMLSSSDAEKAHADADEVLIQIALDGGIDKKDKEELVELYRRVEKYYA